MNGPFTVSGISQVANEEGKDGCKDVKPLTDPEMDESRKTSQQLEDSAKTVVGVFLSLLIFP